MSFKRINNITGWLVCIVACAVYIMTMEATGSLWDCGEFASSAYKLQIPHPPGAPLFALIGRLFMAPFGPHSAATGINLMSALASGFTILFLFWSITHFARKIVTKDSAELTSEKIFGIMAAGVVGALAYTFSDSFWYSAVEGEVYAMSSFFTAIVFWAILKWEQNVTEEEEVGIKGHFTRADRWIILLFFLVGLGVGVHLLMILTIPAIVMIYYYKRYKVTNWGVFWAFAIGCVLTGVAQIVVIQWMIKGAGKFDILFVNSFGMPYFSGFAFFFVLIAALVFIGMRVSKKNNWNFLRLGLWSFSFMILGCFSSYFTTMVRSSADPSVDMYNVDNPVSLVGYLSREQYGDWPILYGQDFTASPSDTKVTETYVKSNGRYEKNGRKIEYVYAPGDMHLFPRMWDQSNDQGHADYYANWMGLDQNPDGSYKKGPNGGYMRNGSEEDAKPTMAENIGFAFSYQLGWMYLRYFMWNFAGKQNDLQGVYMGNVRDGNWKTGIGLWDNARLGDQSTLPDSIKHNKANNSLFALPLILGILGLVYQARKDKRDAFVVTLLFILTGAAIVFYLNQAGNQPRERDYAFVGSFYAFAIWIGLGVLYVKELIAKLTKNATTGGYIAAALCMLAVPILMASQEWDDHDRSHKTMARDLAIDYLQSCDKNAVVISFGDNDTYPLWYAQEVEGIRPDIRVINSSLLGTDWYINQLRYKVNDSDPIDPIWTAAQIEGSNRDIIYYAPRPGIDPNKPMDLYTMMKDYAGSDDPSKMEQGRDGTPLNVYPTKKVTIPVDIAFVKANHTVNEKDSVVPEVSFEIPKNVIFKNDAAVLNIIAANKWKRPIYFTSPQAADIGIDSYVRQDGLTYRFVPVVNSQVNNEWVYDKMMKEFKFGNANVMGVYFDEENRRHLNSIRLAYAQAAASLADNGEKDKAKQMLHKCDEMMLDENFPYGMVSRGQQHNYFSIQMLMAAYKAGDTALADKISRSVKKDLEQQMTYLTNLSDSKQEAMQSEIYSVQRTQRFLMQVETQFKNPLPPAIENAGPTNTAPVAPKPKDTAPKK
ncbi:protein O-mannosyl-transferase family [Ferruginibacter sp.]